MADHILAPQATTVIPEWIVWDQNKLYWTLAITLVSFLYYNYVKFTYWSSRGIKGPMPIPILGTDFYYIFNIRTTLETKWRKKYGKVYGIYNGVKPVLIVSDRELIKHIFVKDFDRFTNRFPITVSKYQNRFLFWSRDSQWARKRSIITPTFTSSRMRQMFELMRGCTRKFLTELDNLTQDEGKPVGAVISKDKYMCYALDVIARSCFAVDFDTYRDKDSDFAKKAFAFSKFPLARFFVILLLPFRLRKWLNFDLFGETTFKFFEEASKKLIERRRALINDKGNKTDMDKSNMTRDMIQLMLEASISDNVKLVEDDLREAHYNSMTHDEIIGEQKRQYEESANKNRYLSDFEIAGQMVFFLIAGFETTSSTLSFCFYELANNQAVQQMLYDELIENAENLHLDKIEYSPMLQLKHLDAFVSEILRLYSPVTSIDREVGRDYNLPGMDLTLEKGLNVTVPYFVLHHDSEYWDKPEKFDITRFSPENRANIKSCSFAPFGLGPRHCVGMRFALAEIKLVLTQLILRYRFSRANTGGSYPPEYKRHMFFSQLKNSNVLIEKRCT